MADLLNCHQKWSNCLLQFQVYLHHYMVMFLDNQLNCRTGSTQAYRICVRTMQPTAMRLGIHNSEIIDKFSKPLIHFIWTFHKNSSRSFRTKQWQLPYGANSLVLAQRDIAGRKILIHIKELANSTTANFWSN